MSVLKKLWRWLQARISLPETGPDPDDLRLPRAPHPPADFNQGQLHYDVETQLDMARRCTRQQQNWRYRAGPWQQK